MRIAFITRCLIFVIALSPCWLLAAPPATAPAAVPRTDALNGALEGMVRQAVLDSLPIPSVRDGKVEGMAVRANALLEFVVADYKRRVGEHADGPAWQTLAYTVVAYAPAAPASMADGTGSILIEKRPAATYSMVILGDPDRIEQARVHALMTNKAGGVYWAFWTLQWINKGWHATEAVTPTAVAEAQAPAAVK